MCKNGSLNSSSYGYLQVSRRRRRCSSVRAYGTHISSFFTISVAFKCRKIVCCDTGSLALSCRTVDVVWDSDFLQRMILIIPYWTTNSRFMVNLYTVFTKVSKKKKLRSVHSVVVPALRALLMLASVAATKPELVLNSHVALLLHVQCIPEFSHFTI
ncbi:hypothetical protein TNCT_702911 [Trichonephila clavata]|uniref:Uncharacterized protein n=1 Tax=Trichonephila clavata TaxID=2740835 RepID=A0A8X6KRD5_TRICU|nr:hypothetical protein TNCT_702911 [Trichonephila clavata]